jgi:hypothetical protein
MTIKEKAALKGAALILSHKPDQNQRRTMPLWRRSLETERLLRPLLRRDANTARPFAVDMRLRKPCLFLRLVLDGWYVRLLMA